MFVGVWRLLVLVELRPERRKKRRCSIAMGTVLRCLVP